MSEASSLVAVVVLAAACGAAGERAGTTSASGDSVTTFAAFDTAAPTDTATLLEYPQSRQGHLVARASGEPVIDGSWHAQAGICKDPAMLHVVAQDREFGTIILLLLPSGEPLVTQYPVLPPAQQVNSLPAARVGAQVIQGRSTFSFQGIDGQVQVTTFGERVSGSYRVILREMSYRTEMEYVGVFDAIPIEPLPEERCRATDEGA